MKIIFRFVDWLKLAFVASLLLMIYPSCNKQLDVKSSRQANEEGHWTKYEDARSGLIGMYGLFRAAVADNNAHWLWGELRNGNFKSVVRPDLKAIIDGNLNASFPVMQAITDWRRFYAVINACNLFIERVDGCLQDKRYTESYLRLDIAQARAVRAFAYFYMVRIWGDVPLITNSHDGSFEAFPRTNKDLVLSFAENELIAASANLPYLYSGYDPEQLFPNNYYGGDQATWLNAPLTKLAAYALLAHIAAWQGNYMQVAVYTEFIENNLAKSNLSLTSTDDLVNSFFQGGGDNYNQLISFSFIKERGETTSDGHIEVLTLANTTSFPMSKQLPDIYVPKDSISNIFLQESLVDDRFNAYFENYNSEIPVFKKIRVLDGGSGSGKFAVYNSSIVFTRLEEIKLLRAEALAVLGQRDLAIQELDAIRSSRGLGNIEDGPLVDLIDLVFLERRRELMGEGWWWYDQIRYDKLKRNNPVLNDLIDKGGIYWPVSSDVLNRNSKIVQNPYWQ
jgi:starch-binding outer membrane protein, SusD/RagB family